VRHFSSVLGDFFDTVFNIDSRVIRTIGPLLLRPGYLSLEYFAGRRVRYVTPMRMFLFMSLLAFFAVQLSIDVDNDDGKKSDHGIHFGTGTQNDSFADAKTIPEVVKARDEALAGIEQGRKGAANVPGVATAMDAAAKEIRAKADARIAELKRPPAPGAGAPNTPPPVASGAPRPPGAALDTDDENGPGYRGFDVKLFSDKPWHPETNPLDIPWMPSAVDHSLNRRLKRAVDVGKSDDGQSSMVKAMFNVLPQTMLVLMPIFALMLKIAYLFKRRMYMEHLIVALHSHAFIAATVTLLMGFGWLRGQAVDGGFAHSLLGWAIGLTSAWIPLYLLIMQKRVYGQGWPMTIAKYMVLGLCYSVLVSFALLVAMVVGFLTL